MAWISHVRPATGPSLPQPAPASTTAGSDSSTTTTGGASTAALVKYDGTATQYAIVTYKRAMDLTVQTDAAVGRWLIQENPMLYGMFMGGLLLACAYIVLYRICNTRVFG